MNISVYDNNLNRILIIGQQFISCLWSEDYIGQGNFTLELQAIDEYLKKIRPDCYVGRKDRKTLMVVKSVEVKNNKIIVNGFSAVSQLNDVAFIGTISENSTITKSIKSNYDKSSKFKNINVADSNIGDKYPKQISHKSFYELSKIMCEDADIGFKAVKNNNQINIEFYKPVENPNLKFSKLLGNLTDESLKLSNANYKNYAIVLGQGEGENRIRVDVDLSNGEQKRELIIDAKDLQQETDEPIENYKKRLSARGYENLVDKVKSSVVEFNPSFSGFGETFDLGDILTINLIDYGLKIQSRIINFQEKEQNNKIITKIKVGKMTFIK